MFGTLAHFLQGTVNEMLDEVLAEPLPDAIRGDDLDRGGFITEWTDAVTAFSASLYARPLSRSKSRGM